MLKDPIVIIALLALLPALYVVFRAVTRAAVNGLMDDRVQITLKTSDGKIYRRQLKASRDQEVDRLLKEIAAQSKQKRKLKQEVGEH